MFKAPAALLSLITISENRNESVGSIVLDRRLFPLKLNVFS